MKNMFTIEYAGEKVCFEKPEKGLVMIQVSTQGPALGGGAFVYALTNNHETNERITWISKDLSLGDRCLITFGNVDGVDGTSELPLIPEPTDSKVNGFVIRVNGKQFTVGLTQPSSVGVLITDKEGECAIGITGYSSDNVSYTWFNKTVEEGDVYVIDYVPVDECDEPASKIQFPSGGRLRNGGGR